ncbi:hypothetical protein [Roseibium aggregatum]|uniref:Restriction alleviation protein, Lar family n=1 Tax=Roseibium aggregatum TaxID=187304 RepID=A0A0M6Y7M6_9HYPH|nr:hypothetical protein [Roseibium aggregatum]CTQ45714.1 restriction alleviation protein, Lar family [Roseibium aggregatum]
MIEPKFQLNIRDDANPCPKCGSKNTLASVDQFTEKPGERKTAVKCFSCGRRGPFASDMDLAVRRWNSWLEELKYTQPDIEIYPYVDPVSRVSGFRADIDMGPGYHGIGDSPAAALFQAAAAWVQFEARRAASEPN